jgi:hypothetical protein
MYFLNSAAHEVLGVASLGSFSHFWISSKSRLNYLLAEFVSYIEDSAQSSINSGVSL